MKPYAAARLIIKKCYVITDFTHAHSADVGTRQSAKVQPE